MLQHFQFHSSYYAYQVFNLRKAKPLSESESTKRSVAQLYFRAIAQHKRQKLSTHYAVKANNYLIDSAGSDHLCINIVPCFFEVRSTWSIPLQEP